MGSPQKETIETSTFLAKEKRKKVEKELTCNNGIFTSPHAGGGHFLNGDALAAVEFPTCETMMRCIAGARVTLSDLLGIAPPFAPKSNKAKPYWNDG
eukprot:s516_g4.t1